MRPTLLATSCGLVILIHTHSTLGAEDFLGEIVVTAKRFAQQTVVQPAHVWTIDRREIARSGANNLPELLQRLGGFNVRSLYGGYPANVTLDARGFGETGASHVLVLLDGRRLNAPDSNEVQNWSAIPLAQVERVEVSYGSGSVLYGDNAVGAVINIVTDGRSSPARQAALRVGSFATREANLALAGEAGAWRHTLHAQVAHSDSYRQSNAMDIANLGGRLDLQLDHGRAFLEIGHAQNDSQLPGYLTLNQFLANPRASYSANGNGWADTTGWFLRPGLWRALGQDAELRVEAGIEDSGYRSFIPSFASFIDTDIRTLSLTPRLNLHHRLAGIPLDSVLGLDLYDTDYRSNQAADPGAPVTMRTDMQVESRALYLQTTLALGETTHLTAGARRQQVVQEAQRNAARMDNDQTKNAWDLGLSSQISPSIRAFARYGATFRFPKTDELTTFGGLGIALRPESGRSADLGLEWRHGGSQVQATLYRLDLRDEIAYNLATFRNENLDRTRHEGLTLDGRLELPAGLALRAGYGYTLARFTAGANDGRTLPLVPRHKARLGAEWQPLPAWTLSADLDWVGKRYYGNDYDHSSPQLPAYATLGLGATWRGGPWQVQVMGKNLADEDYSSTGFEWQLGQYPNDGRAVYLTLAYIEDRK